MGDQLIVLGFGRSGTTWMADILSRVTGELVLFEPLHPSVTEHARTWSYRREPPEAAARHLHAVATRRCRKPWLLRNHLPPGFRVEDARLELLDYLWANCGIVGWKDIRLNFALPWLARHELGRVVFVMRHPYAVVSSILNRPNFFEFGGIDDVYALIMENAPPGADYYRSEVERIALMWAVTHAVALPDCIEHGIPIILHEQLYADPMGEVRRLISALGLMPRPLHPSYVMQHSTTTKVSAFWDVKLSAGDRADIDGVLARFGLTYPPLVLTPQSRSAHDA